MVFYIVLQNNDPPNTTVPITLTREAFQLTWILALRHVPAVREAADGTNKSVRTRQFLHKIATSLRSSQ